MRTISATLEGVPLVFTPSEKIEILEDIRLMLAIGRVNTVNISGIRSERSNCATDDDESMQRTYVFPFPWPETLAEHQKRFEEQSKISNGEEYIQQSHWHEKLILLAAKPIDSVLAYVNLTGWTENKQHNLPLKSLSFDEKEIFWKFSYAKLGKRILKPLEGQISADKMQKTGKVLEAGNTKVISHSTTSIDALTQLFNAINDELILLRKTIEGILNEHNKRSDEISFLMEMIDKSII